MKGGLNNPEEHCKLLRNRGLEDLAGFYEWFEENTPIEAGVVEDLPLEKLDEQDFYSEDQALLLINAFILGSEWEQKFPSPELQ